MSDATLEIRRRRVEAAASDALIRMAILDRLRQSEASTAQLREPFPQFHAPYKRTLFWRILEAMAADGLIQKRKSEVGPGYVGSIWLLAGGST